MIELAIATSIAVEHWRNEDDATIATALDVLRIQAEEMKAARHGK